jgi:hypothetical protein
LKIHCEQRKKTGWTTGIVGWATDISANLAMSFGWKVAAVE